MSSDATIIVHKHEAPFVILPKTITEGGLGMSLKSHGLLSYLLGKPHNWKTWVKDIAARFTDGEWAIRAGLKELRQHGYADLEPVRSETGVCGTVWKVSDQPMFKDSPRTRKFRLHLESKSKDRGNLRLRFPQSEETSVSENHHHNKTNCTVRNNNTNKSAAGAAGGDGNFAFSDQEAPPPGPRDREAKAKVKSSEADLGTSFLKRWSETYQQWYGIPYSQKSDDARKSRAKLKELGLRPKDLLAYAFRMWINVEDIVGISEGFDPLFSQIKGSRNLAFFLNNIQAIAEEQEEPLEYKLPEKEYQRLETRISKGMS